VITICDVSLLGFLFGDGWFFLSPGVIGHVVGKLFSVRIYFLLVLGAFVFTCSGGLLFPFRFGFVLDGGQSVYRELWLVFSGLTNDGRTS
jgi:hypothetical protein